MDSQPLTPEDELREALLSVNTVYDLGDGHTQQFLLPNFYLDRLVEFIKQRDQQKELDVRGEIAAQKKVLRELVMGAGEYHNDPYEYVVRLSTIKEKIHSLEKFDLTQPVYREVWPSNPQKGK